MATERWFNTLRDDVSARLVETTRTAGRIANEDLAFLRSSNPTVKKLLDQQNARLLGLAQRLIRNVVSETETAAPEIRNSEAVEDNWQKIVDVVDNLLERTDACLDEFTGVIKKSGPGQKNVPVTGVATPKSRPAKAFRDQNMPKPQLLFNNLSKNDDFTTFKPLLRSKPHAAVPLEESMSPVLSENGLKQYKNPYELEITNYRYPASMYAKSDPTPFLPFECTKATFVDNPEAVSAMLAEMKNAGEIAIDLEHHDTHSYIGLVSLMQISTREKDWVVDTLKPWREDLQVLNEVFTNPKIIKVFHGAFMDMMWLQRDLGLYVVGLFDTYHASRSLGYPRNSLAWLLNKFAKFEAQKKYQMADWRIRPLPEEMFDYARSDTHFLLYVFDNMKNELIERSELSHPEGNLINTVLMESKKEALQRYERPLYDSEHGVGTNGWYNMLSRTPALFAKEQFAVFRAVHQWRDQLARKEDESLHFIMSKNVLYNIAREMPMNMHALLGCSHPISPVLKRHGKELLDVVRKAKASGQNGPEMKDFMANHPANIKASADQSTPGTAETVKRIVDPQSSHQPAKTVRSETSNFWGSTINGSKRRRVDTGQAQLELRLALPVPRLASAIPGKRDATAQDLAAQAASSVDVGAHALSPCTKDRKLEEKNVFVIKEIGGSRKRKATELQNAIEPEVRRNPMLEAAEDNGGVDGGETSKDSVSQATQKRAEQKAAHKAQKKLDKEQRKREKAEQTSGTNVEEVFDYANAPSVLRAKLEKNDRGGGVGAIDPYAKSLDAPKGMRNSKKEIPGKSITYKG